MGNNTAKRVSNFLGTSALTRPLFALGAASVLFGAGPAHAIDASTLPQNPNVVGGKDSFSQSGNTLNINQQTKRTVIDWRSFDIGSKAQVNFNQPGTSSIAVNRVNSSANPTQIQGGLHANGQVWILNPNGVFFGKTARVDAAGIVATTANIDDKAFMAGSNKLQFTGADHGSVENQGSISVGQAGLAAFVAPSVRNSGTINATVGRVALAAGTTYTLDLAGDHLVELGLGSVKAVVDNSGKIVNPGGTIALTAKAAGQVVSSVVNVSGTVSASSASTSGGTITLGGDNVTTTATAQLSADAGKNGNGGSITSVANSQGNYAGAFSAKGGSQSGNGGSVETSGKSVHVDSGITINTLASNGLTGSWTLDPDNLTVSGSGDTLSGSSNTDAQSTITASSLVSALNTTDVTLQARDSISIESAIDASGNANKHNLTLADQNADNDLTINLDAAITLKSGGILSGDGSIVNVGSGGLIQNGIDSAAVGATVNLAAATFALNNGGVTIGTDGITLQGVSGTKITASGTGSFNAVTISGDDVTVRNLEIDVDPTGTGNAINGVDIKGTADQAAVTNVTIRGEIVGSYINYYASSRPTSRGIFAESGATNLTISGNDIRNIRTGIIVAGAANSASSGTPTNSGTISNNVLDNTKGAILVQYTDGSALTFSGNSQGDGTNGNEWGVVVNLNNPLSSTSTEPVLEQAYLLGLSRNNGDLTVLDRLYSKANRTAVTVDAASTATAANDAPGYNGNGLGNPRQALSTIQAGVDAVVAGGTVNVLAGNYTLTNELDITKSLSLLGAGVGATNITSTSTGYGVFVDADNTTLSGFTYNGSSAGSYSFKIQAAPGSSSNWLQNFHMSNVAISGSKKTGLDLNGVANAVIDHVTVTGTTNGNGIALTDSANVTITNSTTTGNAWGGLALYQHNADFDHQVNNIRVDGTNTFNEANGIYAEDESASRDFGTVNLAGQGILYVGKAHAGATDDYTFFQTTALGAEQLALLKGGSTATVQGYAGTDLNGNNIFYVDTVSGQAMSIQSAINTAAAGATINVGAGTYTDALNIGKNVDIEGAGSANTIIQPTALLTTGVGHKYDSNMKTAVYVHDASDVTINGVTIDANNLGANAVVFWNNASGTISNSVIENPMAFTGLQTGQGLAVDATGANTTDLTVDNVTFQNWNKNAIDAVTGDGSGTNGGTIDLTVTNSNFIGHGDTGTIAQNGILAWEQGGGTVNATIDGDSFSGLSFNDPNTATATGVLVYGSSNGTVTVSNSDFDSSVQEYISTAGGSPNEVDATNGNTFGGVATSTATLDQLFDIVDKITDGTDDPSNGLVRLVAGQVYATAQKDNIQNAVDVASNGDTVNIQAGTYNQGVTITKNVSLVGESAANRADITGGILMTGSLSDITLKNLDVSGTVSGLAADFVIKDSGGVNNFTMDHVLVDGENVAGRFGVGGGQYSGAVSITNSEFDNITGWIVFDTRSGAGSTVGVNDGTQLTSAVFSNNIINNSQGNVAFRQLGDGSYVDVTISGNTVENVGNATNSFGGIFKVFNAGVVNFSNNTVSDVGTSGFNPAGEAAYGAVLLTRGVNTLNVTGNTFTNNNMVFAVEPGKSLPGTVNFSNNTFDNNKYSIYLPTNVSGSGTINFGAGNNFIDGANTVKDIVWTSTSGLNLTNVKFNGLLGSQMTLDQIFAVEDLITDGMDNAAYGLARINAGNVYVTAASGSIANGVTKASAGDIVNVQDGSYTLAGELDITKSLTLKGQSEAGTDITSNSTGYGINVTADNVSLQNFTYHGPTASGSTYGIKVTPDTGTASDRLLNFDIANVTIDGGYRTGLDLNGVLGATIANVTVSNIVHGNGIALTDSANVTITDSTTSNNAWGGLALYQTNAYYDQQLNNIVVDGSNTFNEANGVYEEDQSASLDMGSLTLAGYNFAAIDKSVANDQYTFFQKTEQDAIDFATDAALNSGHLTLANTYVEGWTGTAVDDEFYVGTGANSSQLLVAAAIGAASAGDTINIQGGAYAQDVTAGKQLEFNFDGVTLNSFTLAAGGAGSSLNGDLTTTGAIALNGDATVDGNLTAASFTSNATLAMTGDLTTSGDTMLNGASTIVGDVTAGSFTSGDTLSLTGDLTASGAAAVNGASTVVGDVTAGSFASGNTLSLTGDLTATGAAALNGASTVVGDVTAGSFASGNTLLLTGDLTTSGAAALNGASTVVGDVTAGSFTSGNTLSLTGDLTASGATALNGASTITGDVTVDSLTTGGTLGLTGDLVAANGVTLGGASTIAGDVSAKTFTANGTLALTGDLSATGAALFNGASTVNGNLKAASITANNAFALNGNATASGAIALNGATTLAGSLTGGSIALGATTLGGDVSLNTSGSNGAITVASVSGAHALGINAGTGNVSLGNASGLTALTDASATTLTGTTYNAGSFVFDGGVTLTAATTTLSTNGGDITFNGDIFGTADGAQSLTLNAGPGTNSGANGDITLQNAGTSGVRLGDMTVSGNDFTALTVWLAGSYNSTLTGNQVFAADTLHTGGNVNSTVGGDASGHIEADGDVNIAAQGDVSGTINGQNVTLSGDDVNASVTATDTATVTGNTVEGSYSADTVSITANNNVDAAVTATDFTLSAKNGSVDGTWTNLDASGSGVVSVNGQTVVGEANFNPAQLVVEGFVLPAGTIIGPNGQLILPQGVLLGLLSPGGGKPKMILVHTVQDLGQLLAEGYSVIVIDLSGKDKGKPIQLASN